MELVTISRRLCRAVNRLSFAPPVTHVYNPLAYAREPHEQYLQRYGSKRGRVVLLGMNPGPFGMAQTGVPFGEVALARDWMGITGKVGHPRPEHPKRPIQGFACTRSEVSGARLWGWAQSRFGTARRFFARFFVVNYCPLAFLEHSGRNRTPDKLPAAEREPLFSACDRALADTIEALDPSIVVGVGTFARNQARRVVGDAFEVGMVLHPSPASPRANRGWQEQAEQDFAALGIELPGQALRDTKTRGRTTTSKTKTANKVARKRASRASTPNKAGKPVLLSGGNPQIAKADGDAPVQAYIAAMPGWKREIGRRLDALIESAAPGVRKAVRYNSPFYGIEGNGWFLSYHCFTRYIKVTLLCGESLRPRPPVDAKAPNARYLHIHEDDPLDEELITGWVRQSAKLPGEPLF